MDQNSEFFRKYVAAYLSDSRPKEKNDDALHIPPSSTELQELIEYLTGQGADPIIIGSVALVIHLNLKKEIQATKKFPAAKKVDLLVCSNTGFRPTQDIDLFISRGGLPKPPLGWKRDQESIGVISWISPSGGYVDFLLAGHEFPNGHRSLKKIGKDPTSEAQGCPVADIVSLFQLKLNSERAKDFEDLVEFARIVGIPRDIYHLQLNALQSENLELVKRLAEHNPVNQIN